MIIALVFVAHVACDWVEISQQHYRKPLRHNFPTVPHEEVDEEIYQDTTPNNRIYTNQTILNQHWNRGVVRKVPKIGNVERVYITSEKTVNKSYMSDTADNFEQVLVSNKATTEFATKENVLLDVSDTRNDNLKENFKIVSDVNKKHNLPLSDQSVEFGNDILNTNKIKRPNNFTKRPEIIENKEKAANQSDINKTKTSTLENATKFLKVVADTISRNTRKGFDSKLKYLEDLKTSILATIEDLIDNTWPEDGSGEQERHRRRRAARGHVEFPSSESSLMTISFLTFAVFLIKLVLQVIQTYKNKAVVMAPAVVAVGRAWRRDATTTEL